MKYYTATEIAEALHVKRNTILSCLDGVKADSFRRVAGKEARVWELGRLPARMQMRLDKEAEAGGYRDRYHLLDAPRKRWAPPIPMNEIHHEDIDDAVKLRQALAPAIAMRNDCSVSAADRQQVGLEAFKRVFGYAVSLRHWQRLFDRTIKRNGASDEWASIELYLSDHPRRAQVYSAAVIDATLDAEFDDLWTVIRPRDERAPTLQEKVIAWEKACEWFASGRRAGDKRRMITFLALKFPELGATESALRRNFERKFQNWTARDRDTRAFNDGRIEHARNLPLSCWPDMDVRKCIYHALENCGGRVTQAFREIVEENLFTPETMARLEKHPNDKSYMPHTFRRDVQNEVRSMMNTQKGDRAAQLDEASLVITYDGNYSMECLTADDFTMPVYFYIPDGDGWYRLVRGQTLIVEDVRSMRILNFSIQPDAQYNSGVIRSLFTHVFQDYGIPDRLLLERGIWYRSKLITGGPRNTSLSLSDAEAERGLRQFGIEITHTRKPQGKAMMERAGGMLQDYMEREPGYCGRDERKDCPEITRTQMAQVNSRQAHPSKFFYSFDQWAEKLKSIIMRYNAAQQDGKRLRGVSPDGAFKKFSNPVKQRIFPPQIRYLLAHHTMVRPIDKNGISFDQRGEHFVYRNEETDRRFGRRMMVWFNHELPEFITVTDERLREIFTVERCKAVNAMRIDDVYKEEVAKVKRRTAMLKAKYLSLKEEFPELKTRVPVDEPTAELGRVIAEKTEQVAQRQRDHNSKTRTVQRLRKAGFDYDENASEEQLAGAAELAELLGGTDEGGSK